MATLQPVIVQPPSASGVQKTVVTVVLLVGGYIAYKKINKFLQTQSEKQQLNIEQHSDVKPKKGGKLFDLNGKPITGANLGVIATDIYNGLHTDWYKPTDQERVIRAFKNTPYGSVKDLETLYFNKYKENLKDTLANKLSGYNFSRVKYWF